MLENPAPFSLNFSSPMTYSSKERSSHKALSHHPPPPTPKIPHENVCTLPSKPLLYVNTGQSL